MDVLPVDKSIWSCHYGHMVFNSSLAVVKSVLKPQLLHYLRLVEKRKSHVIVMDRGRPVAKIIPYVQSARDAVKKLHRSVIRYDDPLEPVGMEDWDLLK